MADLASRVAAMRTDIDADLQGVLAVVEEKTRELRTVPQDLARALERD